MPTTVDALYHAHKTVEFVDVPELGYVMVDGQGAPEGTGFAAALQALYAVSYGAHFLLRGRSGQAPHVMPLEALWWVEDPEQQDLVTAAAGGTASLSDTDRDRWHWRAMIMQPEPIDQELITAAVGKAAAKPLEALELVRFHRWQEGRCAQLLHVGPYAEEGPTIVRLHEGIAAAGHRPRGRHHEIYLGDPRRSAPERLRTILRQPVEPR